MKPSQYIWMNGKLVPWENATTHVMSHALHYGSSVFEGIRCYQTQGAAGPGRAIFRLGAHLQRLLNSAKIYRLLPAYDQATLEQACRDVIIENDLNSAYIRPLIFGGTGSLGVIADERVSREVVIVAIEWGAYLGEEGLNNGIDCCVTSWRRTTSASNPVLSKAGGHYLNAALIGEEARRNGYAEGISVSANGQVSEGSAENLFIVQQGVIYTPPLSAAILGGITRDSVIQLARENGFTVVEQELPRELLYIADEVFLTGTAAEVTPVRSVDGIPVAEGTRGKITKQIQDLFFGLFDGRTEDKFNWLDRLPCSASVAP